MASLVVFSGVNARNLSVTGARKRPASVLFIANTYPYWTGTDAGGLMIIRRLAERGHLVTVLQTWSNTLESELRKIDGVTIAQARGQHMYFEHKWLGWFTTVLKHRADVCILNKGFWLMRHEWIDLGARLGSRRYVALENHPPVPRAEHGMPASRLVKYRAAFGLHYAVVDDVIAISRAIIDLLQREYWLPRRKGRVVPYGIDVELNRFDPAGRARMREQLGVADNIFLFGGIGRLADEKGFDRLLPEFARVCRESGDENIRLVIAGRGDNAELLKQATHELGIADKVIFPGWLDDRDRVPFISALDCYLMPSRVEGLGLALLEAMACARPSIGTSSGGVQEILTDPNVGWLVPNDDFARFGDAMLAVCRLSPNERSEVGQRARAHVVENFERDRQADRMIDALLGPFAEKTETDAAKIPRPALV